MSKSDYWGALPQSVMELLGALHVIPEITLVVNSFDRDPEKLIDLAQILDIMIQASVSLKLDIEGYKSGAKTEEDLSLWDHFISSKDIEKLPALQTLQIAIGGYQYKFLLRCLPSTRAEELIELCISPIRGLKKLDFDIKQIQLLLSEIKGSTHLVLENVRWCGAAELDESFVDVLLVALMNNEKLSVTLRNSGSNESYEELEPIAKYQFEAAVLNAMPKALATIILEYSDDGQTLISISSADLYQALGFMKNPQEGTKFESFAQVQNLRKELNIEWKSEQEAFQKAQK
jgi:hypothetical protein